MSNDKKNIFNAKLDMNPDTHAALLAVIGGYLVYLAYQMVRDTLAGASAMSLTTTVVLAGLMALAGLAVLGYGAFEGLKAWRRAKEKRDGASSDEA